MHPVTFIKIGVCMLAMESAIGQVANKKPIGEDQALEAVKANLQRGRVEFVERKSDGDKTVYDFYIMRGDTLVNAVVNGHTRTIDSISVDFKTGRQRLEARKLSKARAEAAALKEVPGEVTRWKLRQFEKYLCYRFHIETPKKKWKEVYVDAGNYKVIRVKEHEIKEE